MEIILTRNEYRSDGIFGTLSLGTLSNTLRTREHAYEYPPLPGYKPKLPLGSYTCIRGQHVISNGLGPFITFEVTGVVGHSGILFHVGNYNSDSEGCILLGVGTVGGTNSTGGDKALTLSKVAFEEFMGALVGVDEFTLHVVDDPKLTGNPVSQ